MGNCWSSCKEDIDTRDDDVRIALGSVTEENINTGDDVAMTAFNAVTKKDSDAGDDNVKAALSSVTKENMNTGDDVARLTGRRRGGGVAK